MRYAITTLSLLLMASLSGFTVQAQSSSEPAQADTLQNDRSVTLRAPSEGVLYLRIGEPGGVRIRSQHGRPPQGEDARQPEQPLPPARTSPMMTAESEPPPAAAQAPSGFTLSNLNRLEQQLANLETRLMNRVTNEFDDLSRDLGRIRGGPETIVLGRGAADTRTPEAEGGRRQDGADAREDAAEPQPDDLGVTVRPPVEADDPDALPPAPIPATPLVREVERAMLDVGLFRSLDVLFETDQATLLPAALHTLNAVGLVLQKYPDLRIEVQGHADHRGPAAYNQELSEARAQAVRRYLVESFPGIEADRVEAVGFGESRPVAEGDSETGLALNRRVEFHVINEEALDALSRQYSAP